MKHLRFLPLLLLLALLPLLAFTGCGEETAPHEHRYGDWYTVTPPTHTETGVEARNCTSCEAKETRSVAATGHTFSEEWDYDADVHFHSCSCGATDGEAPHDPDENGVCRTCRVDSTRLVYTKKNGVITMGTYPQSRVTDEELLEALTAAAGMLPTAAGAGEWTPYGDCTANGQTGDFMWYRDLSLDGAAYRAVYFTAYRPLSSDLPADGIYSEQDDNGYAKGTVYFFRYDPIRWRILSRSGGKVLLLADLVLDAVPYQDRVQEVSLPNPYHQEGDTGTPEDLLFTVTDANGAPSGTNANSYAYSRVRRFLIEEFLRTAFTPGEAALLNAVTVGEGEKDRSTVASIGDRVFLLSAQDILTLCATADMQFRRGSDYAACRGLRLLHDNNRFAGGAYWFLRTPKKYALPFAPSVKANSELTASVGMISAAGDRKFDLAYFTSRVDYAFVGTCPALWLTLAEAD